MEFITMILSVALLYSDGVYQGEGCFIQQKKDVQIGANKGIKGLCSNNGLQVFCQSKEGWGITCDGPGGSFNGPDFDSLVFSACQCSAQKLEEQQQKSEMLTDP